MILENKVRKKNHSIKNGSEEKGKRKEKRLIMRREGETKTQESQGHVHVPAMSSNRSRWRLCRFFLKLRKDPDAHTALRKMRVQRGKMKEFERVISIGK